MINKKTKKIKKDTSRNFNTAGYVAWDSDFTEEQYPDAPIMVLALEGLFDVGEGATGAVRHLVSHTDAELVALLDSEEFYDFTRERPIMQIKSDKRRIRWPDTTCFVAKFVESGKRDLVFILGSEPHLRWRTFARCIHAIAQELKVSTVVTLGSPPGAAPHTRPLGVVGSTTDPNLAAQFGLVKPSYEGPTGLVGVLHELLDNEKMPSFSLKVSVPHYVTSPPNLEASRSLLARLELITGIETGHADLDYGATQWRERIDSAVAADDDIASYVKSLEEEVDDSEGILPSGADLARQMEAFLRSQEETQ